MSNEAFSDAELAALSALVPEYVEYAGYGGRSDAAEERLCEIEREFAAAVPGLLEELMQSRPVLAALDSYDAAQRTMEPYLSGSKSANDPVFLAAVTAQGEAWRAFLRAREARCASRKGG